MRSALVAGCHMFYCGFIAILDVLSTIWGWSWNVVVFNSDARLRGVFPLCPVVLHLGVLASHNSSYPNNNPAQTYNIKVMWPQLVYKNSRNSASCAVWWVHVTNVVGDFPMLCLHDENLSSVIVTKLNHLYFAGYLFIFVGFFLNSACTFYINMPKFWEMVVYKNYPLWFILFSRQIWYGI